MPLSKSRPSLRFSPALVALPLFAAFTITPANAQVPVNITVQVDQPGAKLSPDLYGLMTEEINHAFDGGLYGELLQNRAFKDSANSPVHWTVVQNSGGAATVALDATNPVSPALGQSLKLTVTSASDTQKVGIANDGFWGIPVKPSTTYKASFYAQAADGFAGPLTLSLESADGATVYATATVGGIGGAWKQYTATLKTGAGVTPSLANRFVIRAAHAGTVRFSLVSLFPPTYANRANGNRVDLMQKMADMKPAFLRLPGGNYVDPGHYIWKNTIGPIEQRPGSPGAWGYHVSEGLGILEFMEWCEDLHMQPLLAVTDGRPWLPANGDVSPLVQDALDEIEYITGDPKTTVWGAKRAKDGHPAPFPLRYVEIGNEDFIGRRETYNNRFIPFFDAIRAKYPNLKIIATRGDVTSRVPDIVDEHYYRSAADMEKNAHQYDAYSRTGPKIFVGEWASTEGSPTPTMQAALGDAAWMTGMERNADLVILECYAPLLVNVNRGARQWGTNLIGYDALTSFGSPSYYVQKMFGTMHGDTTLPTTVQQPNLAVTAPPAPTGGVGVGTWKTQAEYKDLKVTNGATVLYQSNPTANDLTGLTASNGAWKAQDGVLSQTDDQENDRLLVGSPDWTDWTDYTFTLKARKTGGAEGFLVLFHAKNENDFRWLNLGGWGNTRTAVERDAGGSKREIGRESNVTVETGRWYDIRVEVKGADVRCYLDNKLIEQARDAPVAPPLPVYASANRDASGNLYLRVVNTGATEQAVTLNLAGARSVDKKATGEVLTGEPGDVNSVETPEKVAPQPLTIDDAGKTFTHTFPAHSVTVVKLKVR